MFGEIFPYPKSYHQIQQVDSEKKNIQSGHDWTNRKGWLFNWKLMIVYMIVSMDWTIFLNQFEQQSSSHLCLVYVE